MTNLSYIQTKIEKEETLYKYRSKLRTPQCTEHTANIRSECAQCRAEFWKDCQKLEAKRMKEEAMSIGIGMVNTVKSEATVSSAGIN